MGGHRARRDGPASSWSTRTRRVPRLLPLRRARRREGAQARRDARLRPDDAGPRARARAVAGARRRACAAGQPVVTVAGEAVWPLTWYLRDVNVELGLADRAGVDARDRRRLGPGGRAREAARRRSTTRNASRSARGGSPDPTKVGNVGAPDARATGCASGGTTRSGARSAPRTRRSSCARTSPARDRSSRCRCRSRTRPRATIPRMRRSCRRRTRSSASPAAGPASSPSRGAWPPTRAATSTSPTRRTAASRSSTPTATFVRAFGVKGPGDGQLNEPCGVAVGPGRRGLRRRHLEPSRRALRSGRRVARRLDRSGARLLRPARRRRSRAAPSSSPTPATSASCDSTSRTASRHRPLGRSGRRTGTVRRAGRARGRSVRPDLRRRHREPPRPGLRRGRQVPPPVPGLRLEGLLHRAVPGDRSGRRGLRDRLLEGPHRALRRFRARS